MSKTKRAIELFNEGFNCSQAVFSVFADKYGISEELALKIACGFGGGVRNSEICGAVSGGVMVIGICYGHADTKDDKSKLLCYDKTREFTEAFKRKNKSIVCRDLLGCEIFIGDGMQQAQERNLFKTICVDMICDSIDILEKLGY